MLFGAVNLPLLTTIVIVGEPISKRSRTASRFFHFWKPLLVFASHLAHCAHDDTSRMADGNFNSLWFIIPDEAWRSNQRRLPGLKFYANLYVIKARAIAS